MIELKRGLKWSTSFIQNVGSEMVWDEKVPCVILRKVFRNMFKFWMISDPQI